MIGNPKLSQRRSSRSFHRSLCAGAAMLILLLLVLGATRSADAQIYSVVHNFVGGSDGSEPAYALTMDSSGNIYGSTFSGDAGTGTIFKMTRSNSTWTTNTIYMFTGGLDGAVPYAGVTIGPDGDLYGTTAFGGYGPCNTWGGKTGCGTVFKLHQSGGSWTETVLFYFQEGPEGGIPYGGRVIFDQAGNLYGTTYAGGGGNCPGGCGVVYELSPSSNGTWTEKVLYTFTGGNDGASPWAGVTFDHNGNLYGTTEFGGATNSGVVYQLTPSGSGWNQTVLYSFRDQEDGRRPFAGLTFDRTGNMFGASSGGSTSGGAVFELTPAGSGWNYQTIYTFPGGHGQLASGPVADLVLDELGNIWGSTGGGGAYNKGTVFRLTRQSTRWTYTQLYQFTGGSDGGVPRANLVFDGNGNLYGTAAGGNNLPACEGSCGVAFQVTNPQQLVGVTPCRVVDTRNPNGPLGGPAIQGGTSRDFPITGNCNIPAYASAIAANVTVVPRGRLGYLTMWPTGHPQPIVSLMNSLDGRVKAEAATALTGASGNISIYVTDTADVVVDVNGYYVLPGAAPQGASPLAFFPLPPCRVADTRNPEGPLGGPTLVGGHERDFPILQASSCHIPSGAREYSLNLTVVPHGPLGYLTVWPAGQPRPTISTLNAPTGTATANAAVVVAGSQGQVAVYPTNDTDLVIDINGYFAPPGGSGNGLSFYPASPCRVLDTRNQGGAFNGPLTVDVEGSPCQPPNTAQAYVLNATVIPSGTLGYLTLWADGQSQPQASTLNSFDGAITSNMAIVQTTNGSIDAYAAGLTQLLLDITGYFAP